MMTAGEQRPDTDAQLDDDLRPVVHFSSRHSSNRPAAVRSERVKWEVLSFEL
jgi:hypothetical protein